jgi:hypothetical protein
MIFGSVCFGLLLVVLLISGGALVTALVLEGFGWGLRGFLMG